MNADHVGGTSLDPTVCAGLKEGCALPRSVLDGWNQAARQEPWTPPPAEALHGLLPHYHVISLLGQGGMGAVYKARQQSLDRMVAIKIVPPDMPDGSSQLAERFNNEARSLAQLNHPAIVSIHDFGETPEGLLYIVMEYVEGADLSRLIKESGPLAPAHALSIAGQVCDALAYAHERGIIHRDIKPSNVLIDQVGQAKVADFGLAKSSDPGATTMTRPSMMVGTPDFMAPELLAPGCLADARSDVFSLGVMLFQMLTGKVPRGAFSLPSEVAACDASVDDVVLKAMKPDREARYQSAREFRSAIDGVMAPRLDAVAASPEDSAPAEGPEKKTKERSLSISLGAGRQSGCAAKFAITFTVAATVMFGAFLLLQGPHPRTEKRPTDSTVADSSKSVPHKSPDGVRPKTPTESPVASNSVPPSVKPPPAPTIPKREEQIRAIREKVLALEVKIKSLEKTRADWADKAAQHRALGAYAQHRGRPSSVHFANANAADQQAAVVSAQIDAVQNEISAVRSKAR